MKLIQSSHGQYLLHVWREGQEYYSQKSPIFLKEFTNVLFSVMPQPPDSSIIYYDITKRLPFSDESFDAVNVYHVFEHLSLKEGEHFAAEIFRIMKPGGIFRISVPDLERIAKEYIDYLQKSLEVPSPQNLQRYHWTVLEMIDQATRETSGGMMLEAIKERNLDMDFILKRYRDVFAPFLGKISKDKKSQSQLPQKNVVERLRHLTPKKIAGKIKRTLENFLYQLSKQRRLKEMADDPRKTKEAVKWMHDRLSLRLLIGKAGFIKFCLKDFNKSDIPYWPDYNLDQSNYGEYAIDPSVYVECRKK